MTLYTLQVSNHREAGSRLPTQEAGNSWKTVYDGPIATAADARAAVDQLGKFYRHARAFRGNQTIGQLWYASYDMSTGKPQVPESCPDSLIAKIDAIITEHQP